jgi:hypothetical protein
MHGFTNVKTDAPNYEYFTRAFCITFYIQQITSKNYTDVGVNRWPKGLTSSFDVQTFNNIQDLRFITNRTHKPAKGKS